VSSWKRAFESGEIMGMISLAEIEPDMVLAADLKDHNGRFLLSKGTKLTAKNIRVFKMWGVIEADIDGVSQNDVEKNVLAQLEPAVVEAAEKQIRERFLLTDLANPVIQELYRCCKIRIAQEITRKDPDEFFKAQDLKSGNGIENTVAKDTIPQVDPAELIKQDINLSTLPTVFSQINETIQKPTSSAGDMASVIGKDVNLSAKLLKIVNSAFYGFPSRVETLTRAVSILGTKQLSTLAIGVNILTAFNNIPDSPIDMKSFWEHSIACGTLSRIIASYKGIQNTERLFLAGLIHDIGRLVLYNYAPIHARSTLQKAIRNNRFLYEIEHETLSFNHTTLGAMLLRKWKLPKSLENTVEHHHSPQNSQDPLEPAIVHLADIVTIALGIGSSGERFVPPIEPEAWECIGLSPNILSSIIDQLDNQLEEMLRVLNLNEL